MVKYTFIIPVYNVEVYLKECIESILCQTYTDYSIILVDDGSTDKSGIICDSYVERNNNITVIHKKNGGLSSARNAGLQASKSKYIIFLDSDDYWNSSEGLYNIDKIIKNDNIDILCFSSQNYYEDSGKRENDRYYYPEEMNQLSPQDSLKYQIEHDLFNLSACKKVYRRDFLVKNDLFFVDGIKCEDIELGLRIVNHMPSYKIYNDKLYTYRHRKGSISTSANKKHIDDYIWILEKYIGYQFKPEVKEYIMSYVAYQYALLLTHLSILSFKGKKEYLKHLKKYSFLFKYTTYPRMKIISKVYRIVGFNLTRLLLLLFLKFRK